MKTLETCQHVSVNLNVFEISPPLNSLLHFKLKVTNHCPYSRIYQILPELQQLTGFFPSFNFNTCELKHVLLA